MNVGVAMMEKMICEIGVKGKKNERSERDCTRSREKEVDDLGGVEK